MRSGTRVERKSQVCRRGRHEGEKTAREKETYKSQNRKTNDGPSVLFVVYLAGRGSRAYKQQEEGKGNDEVEDDAASDRPEWQRR